MTQAAADYLEAIDHLPVGGKLYLKNVGWDEYEELLNAPGLSRMGTRE